VKVALGVVHDAMVDAIWVGCLLRMKAERPDLIDQTIMVEGGPGSFDVARNKVAEFFLEKTKATHLLTVDTDMVFTSEHLDQLLERDVSVVSGAYFVNDKPPRPCFNRRDERGFFRPVSDWEEDELIEVDALGHGFCLIRRDVLTDIGQPDPHDRGGPWYRQDAVGASGQVLEPDYAFCQRAQQAGHKVHVDTRVFVGHNKPRVLGYE
jgi:hypothetical protein